MPAQVPAVALVTGCSSGIGHATALHLHRAGMVVYATARDPRKLADLAAEGLQTLALDVTDEQSMVAAVERITEERGGVDVLINNAGYKVLGPVEEVPGDEMRKQFETNVFGWIRLTQLVLPGMRKRGYGRIVNLGSIADRFATPGNSYPAATKHAIAAFTEALRIEVAPWGVAVSLIEPAATKTKLGAKAVLSGDAEHGPYAQMNQDVLTWHEKAVNGPPYNLAGRFALESDDVARKIVKIVSSKKPRGKYPVGILVRQMFLFRRWMAPSAFEIIVKVFFPRTKSAAVQAPERVAVK